MPEDADLYGLGEVTLPTGLKLPRDNRIITLFNRDLPAAVPYANLYGSHPFLLQVNKGEGQRWCLIGDVRAGLAELEGISQRQQLCHVAVCITAAAGDVQHEPCASVSRSETLA